MKPLEPFLLIIFGSAGNLSHCMLTPALFGLSVDVLGDLNYAILGVDCKKLNDEDFTESLEKGIVEKSGRTMKMGQLEAFKKHLYYFGGDVSKTDFFKELNARVVEIEHKLGLSNSVRIFYLAIPPTCILDTTKGLEASGLVNKKSRLIVEKPVGIDWLSSRQINQTIGNIFDEDRIYRMDHYLAKLGVQNLTQTRFSNPSFEYIWNSRAIDHVQITLSEKEGAGDRSLYYDKTGHLRDMAQNHMLQLLALVAMEPPQPNQPFDIKAEKLKVLKALRPITGKDVKTHVLRAQYTKGTIEGLDVLSYQDETSCRSIRETFVAMKVYIDNARWYGVPFYIKTGKRLPRRVAEIALHLKGNTHNAFVFRLQPDAYFSIELASMIPNNSPLTGNCLVGPVKLQTSDIMAAISPVYSYERLLLDVIQNDTSRFVGREEVETSWEWIEGVLEEWKKGADDLLFYKAGTSGPLEFEQFIQKDGRKWRHLH